MNCSTCHSPVEPGQTACALCGAPVAAAEPAPGVPQEDVPRCAVHPAEPAQADCPRCGAFACRECWVTTSRGQRVCQACATRLEAEALPWDRREELGTVKAWWQTSVKVMSSPDKVFANVSPDGSLGSSLLFSVLSNLAGVITTFVLYMLFLGGVLAATPLAQEEPFRDLSRPMWFAIGAGVLVVYLVFLVGFGAAAVLILAGIEHLMLKLLGADPKPYAVTVRGHALSMAPYVVGLVPVCGLYVYPIWAIVVRVFAYKHFHRITGGKAVAAILLPVAVLIAIFVVGYLFLILAVLGMRGVDAT